MEIDATRLIGVTQARQQFASLLDQAAFGKTFHLMRDGAIAAHLVPSCALVVNNRGVEGTLLAPLIHQTAQRFGREFIERGDNANPGDDLGRVLAWLWDCDHDKALRWLGEFSAELALVLAEHQCSPPTFEQFWEALSTSLRVALSDASIDDFEARAGEYVKFAASPASA
jgi:antitoxin (DNA-binding transcriptional repressor) of toxin-antitoxin stability system